MKTWLGKVAVVTGAANGIGAGIAKRLFDEGLNVVLADYDEESLENAVRALGGDATRVLGVRCDVSLADDVHRLAERTHEHFGAVHVLVNNAGVNTYGYRTWETPPAVWDWVMGVNVIGPLNGIRAFLPRMLAAGEGHIISTISGQGISSSPMLSAYSASKHALLGLSESLYYELAQDESPVRVSVLIPGRVQTTIRRSQARWPERLGANRALGPAATSASAPLGATDPAVPAAAVWEGLHTGDFLLQSFPERGPALLVPMIQALAGVNPQFRPPSRIWAG